MRLWSRHSSKPTKRGAPADDATLAALLEFVSPSAAMTATPVPRAARRVIWIVFSMFAAGMAALGLIEIDRVVTAPGRVTSKPPTIVVQPFETAIVRSIDVHEGQQVRRGDLLARLDSTFATADVDSLQAQLASLQAEVSRLQAEVEERPFRHTGADPSLSLQKTIYTQRESERTSKLEYYRQKIDGLRSTIARSAADVRLFGERLAVVQDVEAMRKSLLAMHAGSRLNLLIATDSRLEIERNLSTVVQTGESAKADLNAMIAERDGFVENWRTQTAQMLSEQSRKLSEVQDSFTKALLRRQLAVLRADRDAIVLTVAKVSEGSVLQQAEQLIALVPADAPLEIESNIIGRDSGFVHAGDPVAIKFDTFPFSQYGTALGTVRVISPDSFTAADQQVGRTVGAVPVANGSTEPFYRSRITIDRVDLHDVPEGFHIAPGMPVTTDIRVGKLTVLGYLTGRILSGLSEGMREP
jgi:hemolysin D